MFATDGTWHETDRRGVDWHGAVAPALVASTALLLAVAVLLFVRRASGAFVTPLGPLPLVGTASVLAAWACVVRLRLRDRRIDWLAAAVIALFAVACSYPGQRAIDWIVWLGAATVYGLLPARRSSPAGAARQMLQQLTRSRGAGGSEIIRGTLLAEFAPGERITVLHVAFCPPFEQLPAVEARRVAGPACEVKVAQILHQGARLEVRLAHASTAAERATIELVALGGTAT